MGKSLEEVKAARSVIEEYERERIEKSRMLMQKFEKLKSMMEYDGITAEERKCIFCGGGTIIIEHEDLNCFRPKIEKFLGFSVKCISCHAEGPYKHTIREAVDAWNSHR